MDFTTGQYIQLIAALMAGILIFVSAYTAPEKLVVGFLVLLIPFQPVTSAYGSINVVLAYTVGISFILRGVIRFWPLAGWVGLIILAYLASFSFAPGYSSFDDITYLVGIGANFVLFYIIYNYVRRSDQVHGLFRTLIVLNVLVGAYCVLQLFVGLDKLAIFGVEEFTLQANRTYSYDPRLAGPFNAVGITAEYFVIQTFLVAYFLVNERRRAWRNTALLLLPANFAFLVATGNRGGIIVLIAGAMMFAWMFRRQIGIKRILIGSMLSVFVFIVMAVIMVNYSQFNRLFTRVEATEIKEGLPDTRAVVWPNAWERIQEKPFLGHGPRLRLIDESNRRFPSGYRLMPYPHNLYLYWLYTIGIIGLVAYMGFFVRILMILFKRGKLSEPDKPWVGNISNLGIIIWAVFMFDQIKLSAMRANLSDYQQYLFVVFALLLAGAMMSGVDQSIPRKSGRLLSKRIER